MFDLFVQIRDVSFIHKDHYALVVQYDDIAARRTETTDKITNKPTFLCNTFRFRIPNPIYSVSSSKLLVATVAFDNPPKNELSKAFHEHVNGSSIQPKHPNTEQNHENKQSSEIHPPKNTDQSSDVNSVFTNQPSNSTSITQSASRCNDPSDQVARDTINATTTQNTLHTQQNTEATSEPLSNSTSTTEKDISKISTSNVDETNNISTEQDETVKSGAQDTTQNITRLSSVGNGPATHLQHRISFASLNSARHGRGFSAREALSARTDVSSITDGSSIHAYLVGLSTFSLQTCRQRLLNGIPVHETILVADDNGTTSVILGYVTLTIWLSPCNASNNDLELVSLVPTRNSIHLRNRISEIKPLDLLNNSSPRTVRLTSLGHNIKLHGSDLTCEADSILLHSPLFQPIDLCGLWWFNVLTDKALDEHAFGNLLFDKEEPEIENEEENVVVVAPNEDLLLVNIRNVVNLPLVGGTAQNLPSSRVRVSTRLLNVFPKSGNGMNRLMHHPCFATPDAFENSTPLSSGSSCILSDERNARYDSSLLLRLPQVENSLNRTCRMIGVTIDLWDSSSDSQVSDTYSKTVYESRTAYLNADWFLPGHTYHLQLVWPSLRGETHAQAFETPTASPVERTPETSLFITIKYLRWSPNADVTSAAASHNGVGRLRPRQLQTTVLGIEGNIPDPWFLRNLTKPPKEDAWYRTGNATNRDIIQLRSIHEMEAVVVATLIPPELIPVACNSLTRSQNNSTKSSNQPAANDKAKTGSNNQIANDVASNKSMTRTLPPIPAHETHTEPSIDMLSKLTEIPIIKLEFSPNGVPLESNPDALRDIFFGGTFPRYVDESKSLLVHAKHHAVQRVPRQSHVYSKDDTTNWLNKILDVYGPHSILNTITKSENVTPRRAPQNEITFNDESVVSETAGISFDAVTDSTSTKSKFLRGPLRQVSRVQQQMSNVSIPRIDDELTRFHPRIWCMLSQMSQAAHPVDATMAWGSTFSWQTDSILSHVFDASEYDRSGFYSDRTSSTNQPAHQWVSLFPKTFVKKTSSSKQMEDQANQQKQIYDHPNNFHGWGVLFTIRRHSKLVSLPLRSKKGGNNKTNSSPSPKKDTESNTSPHSVKSASNGESSSNALISSTSKQQRSPTDVIVNFQLGGHLADSAIYRSGSKASTKKDMSNNDNNKQVLVDMSDLIEIGASDAYDGLYPPPETVQELGSLIPDTMEVRTTNLYSKSASMSTDSFQDALQTVPDTAIARGLLVLNDPAGTCVDKQLYRQIHDVGGKIVPLVGSGTAGRVRIPLHSTLNGLDDLCDKASAHLTQQASSPFNHRPSLVVDVWQEVNAMHADNNTTERSAVTAAQAFYEGVATELEAARRRFKRAQKLYKNAVVEAEEAKSESENEDALSALTEGAESDKDDIDAYNSATSSRVPTSTTGLQPGLRARSRTVSAIPSPRENNSSSASSIVEKHLQESSKETNQDNTSTVSSKDIQNEENNIDPSILREAINECGIEIQELRRRLQLEQKRSHHLQKEYERKHLKAEQKEARKRRKEKDAQRRLMHKLSTQFGIRARPMKNKGSLDVQNRPLDSSKDVELTHSGDALDTNSRKELDQLTAPTWDQVDLRRAATILLQHTDRLRNDNDKLRQRILALELDVDVNSKYFASQFAQSGSYRERIQMLLSNFDQSQLAQRHALLFKRFGALETAHSRQMRYMLSFQERLSQVEFLKSTVKTQEEIIKKMQKWVATKLRVSSEQNHQLSAISQRPMNDTSLSDNTAVDSTNQKESPVASESLNAMLRAKDARIRILEDQLTENAQSFAQELSRLKLQLMEAEAGANASVSDIDDSMSEDFENYSDSNMNSSDEFE